MAEKGKAPEEGVRLGMKARRGAVPGTWLLGREEELRVTV